MLVKRIYYNADGDSIRVDDVTVDVCPPAVPLNPRLGTDQGLMMRVGPQKVETIKIVSTSSLAGSGRVVDSIEVVGEFDDQDTGSPSGPYNITWVSKTLGNGQVVRVDMSGLPVIGDTV